MSVLLKDIIMDFPGSRALDQVSVEFCEDEIHGLIGENGAGKSTLVNILGGLLQPSSGRLELNGNTAVFHSPRDAMRQGIAHVSQEGSLVPGLSGAGNILLGDEPKMAGVINRKVLRERARTLLENWFPGVTLDLTVPVSSLAVADRKVIEIVRALRGDIRLVILDEPTATLQSREKQRLWDIIKSLPQKGVGVILISHFLSEVKALSDKITVLRDGAKIGTYDAAEITEGRMIELMLRRKRSDGAERARVTSQGAKTTKVLSVKNWQVGPVFVPSFDLHQGEVVGLIGLTGAGHFDFARSLYTGMGVTAGELIVAGKTVTARGSRAMQQLGVAFVPDSRMENALMATGTITENLSLVHAGFAGLLGGRVLVPSSERKESQQVMQTLNVRATGPRQLIKTLSGGNKQKVSLGKWLYGAGERYRVMIFIEPTEGVDIGAKQEIYTHMRRLAEAGVGIIVASSDLHEIESVTERVVSFVAGQLSAEISNTDYSEARFISAMAREAA